MTTPPDPTTQEDHPMTTNDERLFRDDVRDDATGATGDVTGDGRDEQHREGVMPDGYREGADPQTTGVITSGHPERVSGEDDVVTGHGDHARPRPVDATGAGADGAWDRLAAEFVDDPQRAVDEAVRLVREAVERSTTTGGTDTEDLRTAFRRLRDLHRTLVAH